MQLKQYCARKQYALIFKMYLVYLSYGLIGKIDLFWGFHGELFDKMSKLFVVIFDMCTNKIREGVKICNCNLYFEKVKDVWFSNIMLQQGWGLEALQFCSWK